MLHFAAFCECLMWLQFLFVLVAQSRQTLTSIGSKPLVVVVCVGSPTKLPGKSSDSGTFSSGAVGQKDQPVSARLESCPFPLSLSCISSWSLGYVLVQGKRKREGMICHQSYCNWTSFSKRHSIFPPKFLSLLTAGLLAKHLTFFDSFFTWDVWIATYVLLNFQNDHLDQRSKSWAHLCDVRASWIGFMMD